MVRHGVAPIPGLTNTSTRYMPSNDQLVSGIHQLLASDLFRDSTAQDLSPSGRSLLVTLERSLKHVAEFLERKNESDQIQDFIWYLSKSRLSVDTKDLGRRATKAKAKADLTGAFQSLRTISSLLMTNSEFRGLLSDLGTEVGQKIAPSETEANAVKDPTVDSAAPPTTDDLKAEVKDVTDVVANGAAKIANEAGSSLSEHVSGPERDAFLKRLKAAVGQLRQKPDYTESVSVITLLLRRLLHVPRAGEPLGFVASFGDKAQWDALRGAFAKVMEHAQNDPEFERHADEIGDQVQKMLTDPTFFDDPDARFAQLRDECRGLTFESSLGDDLDALLAKAKEVLYSIPSDPDIKNLEHDSKRIIDILSPGNQNVNKDLVTDSINVIVPALIQAVQYIPIPRLEVSSPHLDLLLENLILEPGKTINNSSFLPYRFKFSAQNDIEIRKGRVRTTSNLDTYVRLSFSGISVAASDIGYWLRCHSGLLRFTTEGISSFHIDEQGIDVVVDLQINKDRIDELVSLRQVRVLIHHFDYTLDQSKLSFFAWIVKPFLRPLIRMAIEATIAIAIKDACLKLNRELLFARERLRATRIAAPDDLWTFIRAVAARLTPRADPNMYSRVGIDAPGQGVFKGRYAPGSLAKLWHEEAEMTTQRVDDFRQDGWRNQIFDI
ncbi:unnamed protein product [Parascedosporium putredinis]|uniref:HAM1-like N-terminal domain-containing protein n=1 Tax=Parascedosporium putredinis TaxID=1442378 RepID=A0A9P1HCY3_9PEZI|nr:unnamed protein product [Parascedosporium putredinis]CAI8004274.1 unnamed protein product [Parascedosporium putredinis]